MAVAKSDTKAQDLDIIENIDDFEIDYPEDFPDFTETDISKYLSESNSQVLSTKRESTRGQLAIIYTLATFLMFVLGFVVSIVDAAWRQVSIIDNLTTVLPLISGIFLGSLGFVLGYYFRRIEDQESQSGSVTLT
jgi:hypothetical protein